MGACEHESMSAERIDPWTWLTRETDVTHQVACNIEFVFSRNANIERFVLRGTCFGKSTVVSTRRFLAESFTRKFPCYRLNKEISLLSSTYDALNKEFLVKG